MTYQSPHPRDVDCPKCGAKGRSGAIQGQRCRTATGKTINDYDKIHRGRTRVLLSTMSKQKASREALLDKAR